MLESIGIIILLGFIVSFIFGKIKIPKLVGMIITGIIIGPFCLNIIDPSILEISPDIRQFALVVILTRAGLSLNVEDLKKVGRPGLLMCFVPATFEILAFTIFAPMFLGVTILEGAIIGSIIAAVSPAVVVPRMLNLMNKGYGNKNSIPQLILAGASVDDIYAIVVFTALVALEQGGSVSVMSFINIPLSIILGLVVGYILGKLLNKLYEININMDNTIKFLILLSVSFLLLSLENLVKGILPFSALISIMAMGMAINKENINLARNLEKKYGEVWIFAEIFLFILVGASVNINYALKTGVNGVVLILIALIIRMLGVLISLIKTKLTKKERIFTMLAYTPKATVQAAMGGVPLAMGLACGETALAMAVLSILITAPLGAIFIDTSYKKLLTKDKK